MEQEHIDPEFKELYDKYIREEKEESLKLYNEIAPQLILPVKRIRRWWYTAAAAVLLLLITGTWALTSNQSPFHPKPKYTETEVRESLEKTIRALSIYSKTVREEFSRVEDLTAMTNAIKPGKKAQDRNNPKIESNTTKN
jgi:hypothetical protein